MGRIRDEVIPAYEEAGPAGGFALAMIRAQLRKADEAVASGDVVAMAAAYQDLKEIKI